MFAYENLKYNSSYYTCQYCLGKYLDVEMVDTDPISGICCYCHEDIYAEHDEVLEHIEHNKAEFDKQWFEYFGGDKNDYFRM